MRSGGNSGGLSGTACRASLNSEGERKRALGPPSYGAKRNEQRDRMLEHGFGAAAEPADELKPAGE